MAPRRLDSTAAQTGIDDLSETSIATSNEHKTRPPQQIVWLNVYLISALHLMALYGLYLLPWANAWTWLWIVQCFCWGGMGVTVGAHRLWTHRSYKATWPLRLYLMIVNCMAAQNDIFEWTRDHRVHHKYSETDADPHNAKRGSFSRTWGG
ncbi:hypothetical protein OS493_016704 [Desmophyllum pertusum]|uniref:Uncharacterized protein n=1 Tax=Desmophyllum pertusum TaxID=174260 RepID=A0A9W9Z0H9_9CNID|nr:hypothetical protein OS493_016704 [Desmophyllum pertusum]